ncbi:MAG: alcohol dehydrogenase catalytic domain-containing protein [Candidatus Helarchaeota archaeon]
MMNAAVFDGKNIQFKKNIDDPEINKNEVLIKVDSVGICGTDIVIVNGNLHVPLPIIPGHEFSGTIIEVDPKLDKKIHTSLINARVTSEINTNICGECFYCQNNIPTQCIKRKAIGIDINGALAEKIAVHHSLIHQIPDSLSFEKATFIEPLAAAIQTFELMPIVHKIDKNITIFGLGKLGLLIFQVLKSMKLKDLNIILVGKHKNRIKIAEKLGAKNIINISEVQNVKDEIYKFTNKIGTDVAIDTTGSPDALNDIVRSTRSRGKVHIKSTYGTLSLLNITDLVVRELKIYTSRCGPFEKAIELIQSNKIDLDSLISEIYTLDKINEAFQRANSKDIVKIIVKI